MPTTYVIRAFGSTLILSYAPPLVLSVSFATPKQHINATFATPKQHINAAFAIPKQHINATFAEVAMTTPYTTVDSSATIKDQNGTLISNLSTYTLIVTYNDGTSITPTVSNAGSGVYTATYATKGEGLLTEKWSFVDASGAIAQDTHILIISY